jgi:hypothetical protein
VLRRFRVVEISCYYWKLLQRVVVQARDWYFLSNVVNHIRAETREHVAAEPMILPPRGDQTLPPPSERNALSRKTACFAFAIALLMLASMLGVAFEKNLVVTLTQHGWGRTLQGIGAAFTQRHCGIGGFVIDKGIDNTLRIMGISDTAQDLDPLGVSYPENLQDPVLLKRALDRARNVDCAPTSRIADARGHYTGLLGFNGEDAGMGTYTRLAFAVFSPSLRALTFGYFAIMLISLLLFTASHHRHRGAMAAAGLLTVALYLVVCSSLLNFWIPGHAAASPGIDLKDPRFLGTLAAFPLLHIIVTWIRPPYHMAARDYLALAAQAAILAFGLHIRTSAAWSLLALPLLWLCFARSKRESREGTRLGRWHSSRSWVVLATVCLIPCIAQVMVSWSYHPFYKANGDLGRHTFWDGVLQSLQYNPAWKAEYGAAVNGATGDELPMAAARLAVAKLPADQQHSYLNADGNPTRTAYEQASKALFLDIFRNDPGFVRETFLRIKPLLALRSELAMYRSLFVGLSGWHLVLPFIALVLLCWLTAREMVRFWAALSAAAVLCAFLAVLPNWLVTVNELVMFDNFTWSLLFLCSLPIITGVAFRKMVQEANNPLSDTTSGWPRPPSPADFMPAKDDE